MQALVLNGPNLNLLGTREPEIYGHVTLPDIEQMCVLHGASLGMDVRCAQSNHEGVLIDALHAAKSSVSGVVLNAGAFTHTSVALRDAITATALPVIELHLSNTHAREPFRHVSLIAPVAIGVIQGFGARGYVLALTALYGHISGDPS